MKISDWIQIIAILVSLIISVLSLTQTRRSILDANRPYISIYLETIDTTYFEKYIAIKNFGKTSAVITHILVRSNNGDIPNDFDLSSLNDGIIAPGQKFTNFLDDGFGSNLIFDIIYKELHGKIHSETYTVKTNITDTLLWTSRSNSSDSVEATAIKQSAQSIIKAFK